MRAAGAAVIERPAVVRCAIYTRKSTEEGLDQDFNSLDAQRESAEAFVLSQRGEGWQLVPSGYDDGGFSGANTDRPALRRLLADVEAGRIDVVLVYKLDRLSRSLLDFTRMLEVFDARKVAFVSVTQKFDTSTSMGRLMLHILLSFAQFEREMIAERTRDKVSAARRKGKWTGGMPVLGYDVAPGGGKLLVNEAEAAQVRTLFGLYLKEPSLVKTAAALNRRGWTTKSWTTREGRLHGGGPFTKSNVAAMLANVVYTGQVSHKGTCFPGEHAAIVEMGVWTKAQAHLRHNARTGGKAVRNKHGALLRDVLRCDACDCAMVHTWTQKGATRYRYYVCLKAQKQGWASCPTKSVPAKEIEGFVVGKIRAIGADPGVVTATVEAATAQHETAIQGLAAERAAVEKNLRRLHAELARLAAAPEQDGAGARLAGLHEELRAAEQRQTEIGERVLAAEAARPDAGDLAAALANFDPVWDALFPREQARILRLLVERVGYDGGKEKLAITFRPSGIKALAHEGGADTNEETR